MEQTIDIIARASDEQKSSYLPRMEAPSPNLSGPQEHIYTTDSSTWTKRLKTYARENRKAPTPAENIIWQKIRGSKLGCKFRRQHAIHFFIVDFVCIEAKLTIELDGEIHDSPEQAEYDTGRTFTLAELGYRELRFTNQQVLNSLDAVLAEIAQNIEIQHTKPSSGSPSPQASRLLANWGPGGEVTRPTCPN